MALSCTILTYLILENTASLKAGSGVAPGHQNWYHLIACLWSPFIVLLFVTLSFKMHRL